VGTKLTHYPASIRLTSKGTSVSSRRRTFAATQPWTPISSPYPKAPTCSYRGRWPTARLRTDVVHARRRPPVQDGDRLWARPRHERSPITALPPGLRRIPGPVDGIRTALSFQRAGCGTASRVARWCVRMCLAFRRPQYGHQPVDEDTPVIVVRRNGGGFSTPISR